MDISKLTPAPWQAEVERRRVMCSQRSGKTVFRCGSEGRRPEDEADIEFVALARNAFDVMMRRSLFAAPSTYEPVNGELRWIVLCETRAGTKNAVPFEAWPHSAGWLCPLTALVEADKWLAENVDSKEN